MDNNLLLKASVSLASHHDEFAAITGQVFLDRTVQAIVDATDSDVVYIGSLSFTGNGRIHIHARYGVRSVSWSDDYDAKERACLEVINSGTVKIIHDKVRERYPNDVEASDFGLASYVGVPLFIEDADPIGLIVARSRHPLDQEKADAVVASLCVYSDRIAQEVRNTQIRFILPTILRESSQASGGNIFRSFCINAAGIFRVKAAFIAECMESDPNSFSLLAFSIKGQSVHEVEGKRIPYEIAPCQHLKERQPFLVEENLQKEFPDEEDFIALGLEAYLGTLLHDSHGNVIGHIALLHDKPLFGQHLDLELLSLLADRVGGELDRHQMDQKRQKDLEKCKELYERAHITLQSIGDAVVATDADGLVEYLNPVAIRLTGWTQTDALGKPITEVINIISADTREAVPNPVVTCLQDGRVGTLPDATLLANRHGQEYAIHDSIAPIHDLENNIVGAVLVFRDVTEERRLQNEVTYQATHDPLTGVLNRREFERRLRDVIESANKDHSEHVLIYMDLDRFKIVNDSCGHAVGDELLLQLTSLFENNIRQHDSLARLGGDEFAVLLEHCSMSNATRIAEHVRSATDDYRFDWGNRQFRVGVSIGLAAIDFSTIDVDSVLVAADHACYIAKQLGGNRVSIFRDNDENITRHVEEMNSLNHLQEALNEDQFVLYAQPIVPVTPQVGQGIQFEVLLRMLTNKNDILLPTAFMPAAERYRLAVNVDRWVIANTLAMLMQYDSFLHRLDRCTINLSGQSLCDPALQKFLLRQIRALSLPAEKLYFEITETAAISNLVQATRFMESLRERGCGFCLDDFGTGLSSFGYLRNLPIEIVKIDGIFIQDILVDSVDLALVRSINEVAQLLGKMTIAEHVENDEILEKLRELGIDCVQGYGVGRPEPLREFLERELKTPSGVLQ